MAVTLQHTPETFALAVEDLVWKHDISYFDAILQYVEDHGLEVESIPSLMKGNSKLKAALQEDAENLHFMPKTNRLPV